MAKKKNLKVRPRVDTTEEVSFESVQAEKEWFEQQKDLNGEAADMLADVDREDYFDEFLDYVDDCEEHNWLTEDWENALREANAYLDFDNEAEY